MTLYDACTVFLYLVFAHLLLDYPLQGDYLARGKNRFTSFPGVPWQTLMLSHSFLQAGGVFIVTGSLAAMLFEFITHTLIDIFKCEKYFDHNLDQLLHIFCKFLIVLFFLWNK